MQESFERVGAERSGECWNYKHPYSDADDERKRSKSASDDPCKRVHKSLEILAQIHPGVEMRYLFFIAIEHQCRLLAREEAATDHALALLTPARMINIRIHVRVETVFARGHFVPGGLRLFR